MDLLLCIHWLACEKATKCIANPLQYSYVDFCICELWSGTVEHGNHEHLTEVPFSSSNNAIFCRLKKLQKKHSKNTKKRLSHNLSTFEVLQIRFAIIQFPGFESSTLKAIFNDEIYCIDALTGLNENENALLT